MRTPPNEALASDIAEADQARVGGSERRCILSGANAPREALLRLAISPDGPDGVAMVLPDPLAKAPGRGAWIGVTHGELDEAQTSGRLKGALARAFKGAKLEIPRGLADMVEQALRRSLLQRLGLELRAGQLLLGTDRIAERARAGMITWLGHASDAGEDGCRKLDQAWRVGNDAEGSGQQGTRLPLDRAALSVALGRDNAVHLALADHASAKRVMVPLRRLLHFIGAADAASERSGNHSGERAANHAACEPATAHREYEG